MENRETKQQRLMAQTLNTMLQLDFIHLAILSVNLSQHQHNILQHNEMERLRSSQDDQSLPN